MIFLIGVDHRFQYANDDSDMSAIELFRRYLKEQAAKLQVVLIAEEFSREALINSRASSSTAKNIAESICIEHRFCDPDSSERKALGIPRKRENGQNNFQMREKFWFDKIADKIDEPIIFICGNDHLESFKEKVINEGCEVEVLQPNIRTRF